MLVYVTVFMSPHIIQQCDYLYELTNGQFVVIETKKITKEREMMGYQSKVVIPYVKRMSDDFVGCNELILNADTVIYADIPNKTINKRISKNKLTFYSSERLFKIGFFKIFHYKLWIQVWSNFIAYNKNTHLLCDGSYVGKDFALLGLSKKKMWKHGYFPVFKQINIEKVIAQKNESSNIKILWVGRIINWKKPLEFLEAIKKLKDLNPEILFHVDLVGSGDKILENKILHFVKENQLQEVVFIHGFKNNEEVFQLMCNANIFVSSSNRREGWGAVVNEAMSNGCAVIASNMIGCARFLISECMNGLTYKSGNPND
jgi:glycosyltransferase involved in cell wall biosynthesis